MADNIQFRVDAVLGDTTMLRQQIQSLKTNLNLTINNTQALQSIKQVQTQINNLRSSMANINLGAIGGATGGNGGRGGTNSGGTTGHILNANQQFQTSVTSANSVQSVMNNLNSQINGTVSKLRLCTDETGRIVGGTAEITKGATTWVRNIEQARDTQGQVIEGQYRLTEQGRAVVDNTNKHNGSLAQQIKMQFKQYAIYYAVSAVIQGIVESISNTVNYAVDLNDALTNIRVVTMDTKDATQDLLDMYNQMGQELGASTLDIAEGAVDWLRQGFSQEDTAKLVEASTIASKLALIDNAEATEYLTSALKGYKLEAEDAIGVIDMMTAIDLEAATSAGDMFEALSRTANMARTTGFEMNEVAGMIATMSEVTQNSASTIGNSVKTILSRMSNVKAGLDDFEGESLNDVEKVLNRVGIALRDNQGNWYDFYDVLDEISSKWDSFSDVQQAQITTALGGTRQRENILVALENWDKVKQYAQTGAESVGTAMEKYGIVLEGVSAKQEQLTAKVEEFKSNILSSDLVSSVLEISQGFMDIMNLGDGLLGKLLLISIATTTLIALANNLGKVGITSFSALIAKVLGLTVAEGTAITATTVLKGLLDSMKAHPVIFALSILTTVIVGVTTALDAHNQAMQESIDKANELTETYKNTNKEFGENIESLDTSGSGSYASLVSEFEALCKGVDEYGNNISLTSDQYERYKSICEQLVGLNPSLIRGYDSETEAIGNKNGLLQNTIDLLKEEQRIKAQEYADESDDVLKGVKNEYDTTVDNIKNTDDYDKLRNYRSTWKTSHQSSEALTTAISNLNNWDIIDIATDDDGNNPFYTLFDKNLDEVIKNWDKKYKPQFETIKKEITDYAKKVNNDNDDTNDVDISQFETEYDNYIKAIEDRYIGTDLGNEIIDSANKVSNQMDEAENILADSMNDVYDATAQSVKGYYDLSGGTKSFIEDFYDENFNVDENTTQEVINKNKKAIQKITKALVGNTEVQSALDEFYALDPKSMKVSDYQAQYDAIIKQISKSTGQSEAKVKLAIKFDADVKDAQTQITNLTSILKKDTGRGYFEGLSDSVEDVQKYLEGLSVEEIDRAKLVIQKFSDEAGNLNTNIIDSVDTLDAYIQRFNDIDNALNGASEGFASATSKAEKFKNTLDNITEYDNNFNSYTSAIEALETEFENGTTGSKTFAEACKYLFGDSFDVTNVDKAYTQLQKVKGIFEEETYGEGMLEQLSKIDSKFWDVKQNADGTWDFDLDTSEKGIKAMAKALGTTEEGVWACIEAMQMLGGVDLFDSDTIYDFASQFGELGFVVDKTGKQIQAINVQSLRNTLEEAGISTTNLDSALQKLSEKGIVLLDTSADAETLKTSLSELGLIAKNNVVDVTNLTNTLTTMGYSNDQIATLLTTLKGLDGVSFTNLGLGVANVDAKITELKNKSSEGEDSLEEMKTKAQQFDQVTLTNIQTAIDNVKTKLNDANTVAGTLKTSLDKIDGNHTVTITYREIGKPTKPTGLHGIGNGIRRIGRSFLKGTAFNRGNWGAKRDVTALTGEIEPEIWVHADTGEWELITNPQFVKVKKGDVIFNGKQTRELLGRGSSSKFGYSFLKGTAFISSTNWGKKKKYGNTKTNKTTKTTKTNNTNSVKKTDLDWAEKQLNNLQEKLDYNTITMSGYINGLKKLLNSAKKGSKAWKEINKELQQAKLDNIENQFKRGEITITQYINKLTQLRKSYKKNTEGYKELTQTINEAKADKFADQYERGEISLNKYLNKLKNLRNSYKKNSEEWKKYNDLIKDTKLDNIESQFENGEITITQYIKKLKNLRKSYKKNSEEYKKLTKTINEAKADKWVDQYERGKISLETYINRLTNLRDSYKKNSEEWKKYNDLINDTNLDAYADMYERGEISAEEYIGKLKEIQSTLDKDGELYKDIGDIIDDTLLKETEEWVEELGEARKAIQQCIDELGDVNTDEERVKYAELLLKNYTQTKADIVAINEKLKDTTLTEEQRVKLQEDLNDLLKDEVSLRDEIEDGVREYYENQRENEELKAEDTKKKTLYDAEKEIYGDKSLDSVFRELATDEAGNFNEELYNQLVNGDKGLFDYLVDKKTKFWEEEKEAKQAEKDALDEINEAEELQNNLIEARLKLQNALNNKTTKILKKQADGTWQYEYSANMADVKSAEEEVKNAEKAVSDYEFEQEMQVIQDKIDNLNNTAEDLTEKYSDKEFWADRDYEATMNSIAQTFGDIDKMVQDWMAKYGGDDNTLTTAYTELVGANNNLTTSNNNLKISIDALNETIGSKGLLGVEDGVTSFDTGGEIGGSGLAFVHDKERVFTQEQNANFAKLLDNIDAFNKLIDVSKVTIPNFSSYNGKIGSQSNSQTVINGVTCVFPNINTPNGLQKAILELPRLAIQQSKVQK